MDEPEERSLPSTSRRRGGTASMGDLIGPPPDAAPKPEDGKCVECGRRTEPFWVPLGREPGWLVPERCGLCSHRRREREQADRDGERLRKWRAERYGRAGLTRGRREKTFENFRLRLGTEVAEQAGMELVCALAEGRPTREPTKGLLFVGVNGCGKTHLALAILNRALDANPNLTGAFVEFADYLELLRRSFRAPEQYIEPESLRETVVSVGLLVLDDLGAARRTGGEWDSEELVRVLNRRIESGLPLIATADLSPDQMADRLGARVVDRLYEACRVVPIECGSYRREMG